MRFATVFQRASIYFRLAPLLSVHAHCHDAHGPAVGVAVALRRQKQVAEDCSSRHHDAHAASFFVSPFEEATILVMDGYGDEMAQSAYIGIGNRLERVSQTQVFDFLGMLYTAVTEHLGFKKFEEGTVMALAATGDKTYARKFPRGRSLSAGWRILRQPGLHQLPHARTQPAIHAAI